MAPFGYLPVFASRYWFVAFNTVAIVIAAYLLVRLFNFTLTSVAAARAAARDVLHRIASPTPLVFTNINGCILLAEVLFFRWLLDGQGQPSMVGRRRRSVCRWWSNRCWRRCCCCRCSTGNGGRW